MPEQARLHIGLPSLLALSTAVALSLLILEWLMVAQLGLHLGQGEVSRTLLGLMLAALAVGIGVGIVAWLSGHWLDYRSVAVAAPVSALLFLKLYITLGSQAHPAAKFMGAAGFVLVVFVVLLWLMRKAPVRLYQAANWWTLAALLAILTLLLPTVNAADNTGVWLAVGAAVFAAALLLQGRRAGGMIWPVLSVAMVFMTAAVLGSRVPVWQPINNFAAGKPSVLLVTIDTLRADHVGAYGHAEARTPNFDALAQQGVRFSQTVTANVFTGPSHASILSGLLPVNHGVLVNHMQLPSAVPTLADILREEGYVTGAFVSGYTTMDKHCGLPSRFQAFDDDIRAFRWWPAEAKKIGVLNVATRIYRVLGSYNGIFNQSYRMGQDTADVAVSWLEENGGRPFFVWTHFFDPHVPYHPPEFYRIGAAKVAAGEWYDLDAKARRKLVTSPEKVAAMISLYDAEVAYADSQLGRVVEAARAAAPDGNLLVVVTSDHGESMGEHGLFWFRYLYDPTLLVPLVIVPPASMSLPNAVVDSQVRLIDLAPTVLNMLEIDAGTSFDGDSLLALMRGSNNDLPRPAFSSRYSSSTEFSRERHAVRDQGWKLIHSATGWDGGGGATPFQDDSRELYELTADAGELNNLVDTGSDIQEILERELGEYIGQGISPDLELTNEERERLRSLGYIQ